MAFLRTQVTTSEDFILRGAKVWARPPLPSDYVAWANLREASRAHLTPWEPAWGLNDLSRDAYRARLKAYARDQREDLGYAFFMFRLTDHALVGGVTLSNLRRGVTQSASLGYWLGRPYVGAGYMTDAVLATCTFGFASLRLHRLEAASMPRNLASISVLERTGFLHEGLARRYLRINGTWEDHRLFARLSEDPEPVHPGHALRRSHGHTHA